MRFWTGVKNSEVLTLLENGKVGIGADVPAIGAINIDTSARVGIGGVAPTSLSKLTIGGLTDAPASVNFLCVDDSGAVYKKSSACA